MNRNKALIIFLMVLVFTGINVTAALDSISFQGQLMDSSGNPASNPQNIIFKIYSALTGGTSLVTITKTNVSIDSNGIYNVELNVSNITDWSQYLYLGITVGSDSEMTPRIKIMPSATSVYSATAGAVSWSNITGIPSDIADGDNVGESSGTVSADSIGSYHIIDSTITASDILDNTILNADINASAAIVDSKLAQITTADKVAPGAIAAGDLSIGVYTLTCASVTITGANVVLQATAAYSLSGGSADNMGNHTASQTLDMAGFGISNATITFVDGSFMNSTGTFLAKTGGTMTGDLDASQITCSSLTISGANVVLQATAAYALSGGAADNMGNHTASQTLDMDGFGISNATITFVDGTFMNSTGTFLAKTGGTLTGDLDASQITCSSITISGANVVLQATAAYALSGGAADNMGNHTATTSLNMGGNQILSCSTITASVKSVMISSHTEITGNLTITGTNNATSLGGTVAGEFLQRDGSVVMTGDLNMGSQDISALGQISLSTMTTTADRIYISTYTEFSKGAEMDWNDLTEVQLMTVNKIQFMEPVNMDSEPFAIGILMVDTSDGTLYVSTNTTIGAWQKVGEQQ